MNWIKNFYTLQYTILNRGDLKSQDYRLNFLLKHSKLPPSKLLELGGGLGEFAVRACVEGYKVTMIDIIESACESAQNLSKKSCKDNIEIICDNFYNINYKKEFDIVCYWDGFGIGSDNDQEKLLQLINLSLKENGFAFIDIYTPWYWSKLIKKEFLFKTGGREYDYDFDGDRMIDCWWKGDKKNKVCQSLKCYSLESIKSIIEKTNFQIEEILPSGYIDFKTMQYKETTDIKKAMSYLLVLKKTSDA